MHIVGLRHSPATPRSTLSVRLRSAHPRDRSRSRLHGGRAADASLRRDEHRRSRADHGGGRLPPALPGRRDRDALREPRQPAQGALPARRHRRMRSTTSTCSARTSPSIATGPTHKASERGQAAGYRAETVVDIPFVRHTGEPLALQFAPLPRPDRRASADACTERNSILPAHEIAAAIEEMLMSEPTFSYVIPVHNQIADLRKTVRLLIERLGTSPGPRSSSWRTGRPTAPGPSASRSLRRIDSEEVAVRVTTSAKGLGFAWRRGMAIARGETFVLTAADLPFGFTDLDGYLGLAPRPLLVMGSKTHPESQIETPVVAESHVGRIRSAPCRPDRTEHRHAGIGAHPALAGADAAPAPAGR